MQHELHISIVIKTSFILQKLCLKNESTYAYATIGSKQTSLNLVTLMK